MIINNKDNIIYIEIVTIIVLIISLIGYYSQYSNSRHKKTFYMFDDKFLLLNGFTCFIICFYKIIIGDIIFLLYNAILLLFYLLIYTKKYNYHNLI
jgi:hypothetical protein